MTILPLAAVPVSVTAVVVEWTIPVAFAAAATGLLLGLGAAVRQSQIDRRAQLAVSAVPPAPVE